MTETKVLAAAIQSRSAFDRIRHHVNDSELSPQGKVWWPLIKEWYAKDRQATYRQLFRAYISGAALSEIRECTHKGWALGGERFREQIEALGKRRAASKGVGRPRKVDNRV